MPISTASTLLTEREEIVVVESHDWLPNQAAHFATCQMH